MIPLTTMGSLQDACTGEHLGQSRRRPIAGIAQAGNPKQNAGLDPQTVMLSATYVTSAAHLSGIQVGHLSYLRLVHSCDRAVTDVANYRGGLI